MKKWKVTILILIVFVAFLYVIYDEDPSDYNISEETPKIGDEIEIVGKIILIVDESQVGRDVLIFPIGMEYEFLHATIPEDVWKNSVVGDMVKVCGILGKPDIHSCHVFHKIFGVWDSNGNYMPRETEEKSKDKIYKIIVELMEKIQ